MTESWSLPGIWLHYADMGVASHGIRLCARIE